MAKFRKPDGTEIDLGDGVTDDQVKAIGTIVSASLEPVTESIGKAVKDGLAEAIKPVTERIDKIEQGSDGDADDDDDANDKGGDDKMPAWARTLTETVQGIAKERENERTQRTTEQLVKSYVEKNLPNIKGKDRLVKRLIGMAPKDEAALKAGVEDIKAEWKDAGVDVEKAFSASPAGEGAKGDDAGADDAERKSKEKVEAIRRAGPGGLKPVK
ncbi:MAG: hypothetical protein KDA05_12385 [Phycisphaerales bacterium]|nr:hypothetical protein [Phycisphaerales bacterium]